MNILHLKKSIGKYYGYPDCCILEFHTSHPTDFIASGRTRQIKTLYDELQQKGEYSAETYPEIAEYMKKLESKQQELEIKRKASNKTGFIPCKYHSEQIVNGNLRIEELIQNRKHELPFPNGRLGKNPTVK